MGCAGAPPSAGGSIDPDLPIDDLKRKQPPDARLIGTEHPFTLETVARRFIVLCQAREDTNKDGRIRVSVGLHGDTGGDTLAPYLILSEGPGERLDYLVDTDPNGRYIAAIQRDRLWLIDAETGSRTDLSALGADITDDGDPFRGHRAAFFDEAGERLVYLRSKGQSHVAVVRTLALGTEAEIDPGEGRLWRASIDGDRVLLTVITQDTDKNGRLELPSRPTSLSDRACRAPVVSYSVRGPAEGDEVVERVASVHGGRAEPLNDAVLAVAGAALLRREADGSIALVAKDGTARELSPASCGARVLALDAAREAIMVGCQKVEGDEMPVELHSPGKRAPLGFTVPRKDFDFMAPIPPGTRFIPDKGRIIDLEKGVSIQLPDGERVADVEGARVLVARENELLWRDMDTGEERRFPAPRETRLPTRRAGPWIATRGLVINVSTGALLGRYTGSPLALGYDGRLLYDPGQPRHYGQLPRGPLWWQAPLQ